MDLVKVKTKYQITLPASVRAKIGVSVGDVFEIRAAKGEFILKAKTLVDKGIAEGLADVKAGRTYGPFNTHSEMIAFLHEAAKKYKTKSKIKPHARRTRS